jgi:uncharacterized protein DUF4326
MTDRPQRVQLRRTKGWRMPANTVRVDRTTRWGNPVVVGRVWRGAPVPDAGPSGQAVSRRHRERAGGVPKPFCDPRRAAGQEPRLLVSARLALPCPCAP